LWATGDPRTWSCVAYGQRRWRNVPTPQQKPTKAVSARREHQDVAAAMSARDREVLMRFYLHGQEQRSGYRPTWASRRRKFRLIKSRAKATFTAGVLRGSALASAKSDPPGEPIGGTGIRGQARHPRVQNQVTASAKRTQKHAYRHREAT
jgi:hypothetical protein